MRSASVFLCAALLSACTSITPVATTTQTPGATASPVIIYVTPAPTTSPAPQKETPSPTTPPTVAPVPTATPGPDGSRDNPFPLGTAVTVGEWRVTIESVDLDAWRQIEQENMFNDPPAAGFQFVMFSVSATYLGTDTGSPFFDLDWAVVGSRGNSFEEGLEYSCGVLPHDMIDAGDVYNGATARGNVCLSVESNQVTGGTIRLHTGFLPSSEAFFALDGEIAPATPDPNGGLTPGYIDIVAEQLSWIDTISTDTDAITSAGDPWRPRKLRTAVSDALANALDIQSWLELNPPDSACYSGLHSAWSDYVDAYVEGLDTMDYGLMPPITYSDVSDGLQQLIDATDLLDDVTTAMDATTCL